MFRMLSLAIDLFAALAVLLPAVLLIQYGLFGQRGKKRLAFFTAFAVYLSLVFSVTGLPSAASPVFDPSFNWIPLLDIRNAPLSYLKNTVLNILLFMPLGFFLPAMDPACRSPRRILLAGLGLSLFIELLQIFTYRLTDVDDLLTNALGAFLGYALTVRLPKKKGTCPDVPSGRPATDASSARPMAAVLFAAVLLNSFFVQPALSSFFWELVLKSPLWEAVR